jgi:hypothetical protein
MQHEIDYLCSNQLVGCTESVNCFCTPSYLDLLLQVALGVLVDLDQVKLLLGRVLSLKGWVTQDRGWSRSDHATGLIASLPPLFRQGRVTPEPCPGLETDSSSSMHTANW